MELNFELIRWLRKNGLCKYREAIGFKVSPVSDDEKSKEFCKALFEKCLKGHFPFKFKGTSVVFHHSDFGEVSISSIPPDIKVMIENLKSWKSWLGYLDHPHNDPRNGFKYEVMTCF